MRCKHCTFSPSEKVLVLSHYTGWILEAFLKTVPYPFFSRILIQKKKIVFIVFIFLYAMKYFRPFFTTGKFMKCKYFFNAYISAPFMLIVLYRILVSFNFLAHRTIKVGEIFFFNMTNNNDCVRNLHYLLLNISLVSQACFM